MLKEMLTRSTIELDLKGNTKKAIIDELVGVLEKAGKLNDPKEYKNEILKREAHSSTGLEEGIAIPHAKTAAVKVPSIAFGLSKEGVDYESLDGEPSKLFFMIAAPANASDTHIEVLSKLTTMLLDDDIREKLLNAKTKDDVINTLIGSSEENNGNDEKIADQDISNKKNFILAVTACPTGIAHTYMAAEALNKKAAEMGIDIKVETNGSIGVKNQLTEDEIKRAKGIIVACDKNIEMARFDGKPVLIVPVKEGIKDPEKLIKAVINGDAPIYKAETNGKSSDNSNNKSKKERTGFYKHLMSGVSNMLPFVIGGGILIALAFLLDNYEINPSNFGKNTPIAAYLKTIGEQAFGMMLPVLAGFIAMSIADRPGLAVGFVGGLVAKMGATFSNPSGGDVNAGFLGAMLAGFIGGYVVLFLKKIFSKLPQSLEGIKPILLYPVLGMLLVAVLTTFVNPFVGMINEGLNNFLAGMGGTSKILLGMIVAGMMACDMGGPINKAAYVFGTAQLAEGNYGVMAAVMAGGMVPPLGVALATTFFKNKFTKEERNAGKTCYVMGVSFITEGVIPFAASDPMRVIPASIIGSAIAGGLSMTFGSGLMAPHGGIFVFPVVQHPVMYALSILIGSIITCVVLGIIKKKVNEL